MDAIFWGTRGSLPRPLLLEEVVRKLAALRAGDDNFAAHATYGGNTACVELRGGRAVVICDAGSGIRDCGNALLAGHPADAPLTIHLFISHPHWDHIQGFPFFAPAYRPHTEIIIYGGHRDLEQAFTVQQSPPFFPVHFRDLPAKIRFAPLVPGEEVAVAGLQVTAHRQNHPGDSYGFRFTNPAGQSVVYSTDGEHDLEDAAYRQAYLQFIQSAGLLIFDAQYDFAEAESYRRNWGHASNIVGIELAIDARVPRLVLFHADPGMTDEDLDFVTRQSREYALHYAAGRALDLQVAYDGLHLKI